MKTVSSLNPQVLKLLVKETMLEFFPAESKVTFSEYVKNVYIPYFLSKRRSSRTIRIELEKINIMLGMVPEEQCIARMTENDIQILLYKVAQRTKKAGSGKTVFISQSTVNRYLFRLKAIFNHVRKAGIISVNPVQNIQKAKEYPRNRVLTSEEINRFLSECKASRNKELYPINIIALYTGIRLGKVMKLSAFNIHIEEDYVDLDGIQTKSGRYRNIPIHPRLKPILMELTANIEKRAKIFKSYSIRSANENAIKRAKLKDFMCRDLRRTCAT